MARTRSPNYPYIGLPAAIERVRKIYGKEHQGRMSRAVVADHLGFGSLNGVSLSVISALSKYGLLVSIDEDLQVSDDALSILVDPPDSPERAQALRRAALKPDLFSELNKHFGGQIPSDANLLAYLQKHGFTANAAALATKSFRETMQLVSQQAGAYDGAEKSPPEGTGMESGQERQPLEKAKSLPPTLNAGEREFLRSPLSNQTQVRILVNGPAGAKEIAKLIRLLTVHQELMQEDDESPEPEPSKESPPENSARVSFFITTAQKAELRKRGYSDDAIEKMKPAQAHKLLGLQQGPGTLT